MLQDFDVLVLELISEDMIQFRGTSEERRSGRTHNGSNESLEHRYAGRLSRMNKTFV